ncbi:NAD(P)-binding protein [Westerdykella ornata]|uniref:NAD(P)-binding protein n=1 Tax=Westerdykella ornata TaxID=318751 RepID=A0A6A6JP90_WESOR|nr:NAD(P)-binding protein [Westerdykella ornata]KAF2278342.1 NAD(P)-binding protein [Westerdykella ornata]
MAAPFPAPVPTWHTTTYPALSPTRPELSVKGKTVVVTGGGTGIGAETARYFARAGASRIALLGRREQPLLDTKADIEREFSDVEVFAASTDVTIKSSVDAAFSRFLGEGKKIDILVSNAAVIGAKEPLKDVDGESLLHGIQQNIAGALYVAQAFLRFAAKDAVVINVSSGAAHLDIMHKYAGYNVAKIAVVRLWNSIVYENPEVTVFHVQPGVVDTAMNREAGGVAALGVKDDASLPASFMVWLSSPEARFLKGKFVWANWDVDELKSRAKEIESSTFLEIGLNGWPFA